MRHRGFQWWRVNVQSIVTSRATRRLIFFPLTSDLEVIFGLDTVHETKAGNDGRHRGSSGQNPAAYDVLACTSKSSCTITAGIGNDIRATRDGEITHRLLRCAAHHPGQHTPDLSIIWGFGLWGRRRFTRRVISFGISPSVRPTSSDPLQPFSNSVPHRPPVPLVGSTCPAITFAIGDLQFCLRCARAVPTGISAGPPTVICLDPPLDPRPSTKSAEESHGSRP